MPHTPVVLSMAFGLVFGAAAVSPALAQLDLTKKAAPAAAAIDNAAPPPRVATQDAATIVRRANAYFNGITTLVSDFTQSGGDGRKVTGKLYVSKPGRLRFEYAKPSPLEIIADGTSVAIRNRKLATQDLYFISQTPLKFLLKGNLDLTKDTKILEIKQSPDITTIKIEDKATFGGTSRITLVFNTADFTLKNWVISDPQGYETLVALNNMNTRQQPDPALFTINYDRQDSN